MPTPEIAVSEYLEDVYIPDKLAPQKSHNTREQYRTDVRILNLAFHFRLAEKDQKLRNATLSDLNDAFLKYAMAYQLNRGRSVGTANRLYRTVCAVWRHAKKKGYLAEVPETEKYRESKLIPQCWSLDEFQQLLTAAGKAEGWVGSQLAKVFWTAYLWFTYATGARQSVTLALPTENFDPIRGEVLLPAEEQKQDADQLLDLLPEAVEAIAKLRSSERDLDCLFGDWPYGITCFNKRLKKLIVAAGLRENVKKVTRRDLSHRIRKTFATHVVANSDLETARELLGHSSVSVTKRYIDPRFVPKKSARKILPPLRPTDPEPAAAVEPTGLRIHRPEAG